MGNNKMNRFSILTYYDDRIYCYRINNEKFDDIDIFKWKNGY